MVNLVRMVLVCLALTACASKPPPKPYPWRVNSTVDHIPMQGLPAVPRVIAPDRPVKFVNFANEAEREKARQAAIAAGTAGGAVKAGVYSLLAFGPLCVVFPPLCIPIVAAGAAIGGTEQSTVSVSEEEAGRLGAIFEKRATSSALGELASRQLPKAGERDYPRLAVSVVEVVLVPTRNGVTFGLVAEAQGFPGPDQAWKPSLHLVRFPSRSVADWLASDGQLLESELQMALRALSADIVLPYLPYEERR